MQTFYVREDYRFLSHYGSEFIDKQYSSGGKHRTDSWELFEECQERLAFLCYNIQISIENRIDNIKSGDEFFNDINPEVFKGCRQVSGGR